MNDRGNRRPNQRFGDIPVKEGETYEVEIEGIGEKGDGIAKIKGYVIIVPGVKKGDRVKVRINAVRGKVSFGEVIGEAAGGEEPSQEVDEDAELGAEEDAEEEEGEDEESEDEDTIDDTDEEK